MDLIMPLYPSVICLTVSWRAECSLLGRDAAGQGCMLDGHADSFGLIGSSVNLGDLRCNAAEIVVAEASFHTERLTLLRGGACHLLKEYRHEASRGVPTRW